MIATALAKDPDDALPVRRRPRPRRAGRGRPAVARARRQPARGGRERARLELADDPGARRAATASRCQAALTSEIGERAVRRARRRRWSACARATRGPPPAGARSSCSSGEPGIGKSRLAIELAREAHAEGATVLFGRSDAESLVPYQPFVTAVQHYMAHRQTLALPAELTPELSELARLVPALRRHLPELREPIAEDARDAPLPAVRGGHARARASSPARTRRC